MTQIATNAVITAIPVVDQVADVRDIVAIVKQMVWEKRNDIATWFALFITVIGLIPTVGSLLKGVLKAIWHGAKLGEILKIFNYFKKSNGVKWLKELRAGKLKHYAQQAAENAHKLFDALSEKLTQLKAHVPKAMSDTHKALDDTLTRLGEIKGQINSKFAEIAESLKQKLGKSLDEAGDEFNHGTTKAISTRQQVMKRPEDDVVSVYRKKNGVKTNLSEQVFQARLRQELMLKENVGFNLSPTIWDDYPTIGRNGTYISDNKGISDIIGDIHGQSELTISKDMAHQLEESFGLETGSLGKSFKIRKIENITEQMPRSPLEGNQLFLGPGRHLPGGAPEIVINSISTIDTDKVTTLMEVIIK